MTWEPALRRRLLDDAAVAALVGNRVDWTQRPQGSAYPAVVLKLVADPRPQHMGGFNGFRSSRVEANVFGRTRPEVVELREAIVAAITPSATRDGVRFDRAIIENIIDRGGDSDTGFIHRDLIDVTIWHN